MSTTLILIIGGVVLILFAIISYNRLVSAKNEVENRFADVDAILKKRYDLIPNLVATVKQYMTHEKETLTKVTELRSKAASGNLSDNEKVELNNEMNEGLGRIMVAVEAYPDLKANQNFLELQQQLTQIEGELAGKRTNYNGSVKDYHNAIEKFPSNLIAASFNFKPKVFFAANKQERQNVDVGKLFEG